MIKRAIIFVILTSSIWAAAAFIDGEVQPNLLTQLGVAAVNGGNQAASALRSATAITSRIDLACVSLTVVAAVGCFGIYFRSGGHSPGK